MEDRGVLYLICGGYSPGKPLACAFMERLVVSLYTLREHWTGPVTVACETATHAQAIGPVCKALGAATNVFDSIASGRHAAYAMKPMMPTWSPYGQTVFLDADTVVVGDFAELFEPKLALTQFSVWQSQGPKMSKRIAGCRGSTPQIDALVDKQLASSYPAINTGVLGWHRGFAGMAKWAAVSLALSNPKPRFIVDELAMQVISQEFGEDCQVFDCRWNASPTYAGDTGDVRIWHFHGDRHLRKDEGRPIWEPKFRECLAANPGDWTSWAGNHDKWVKTELQGAAV